MRILFAGTPSISVPSLRAIHQVFPICGVLTAPDQRQGRGRKLAPSPVKAVAEELDLPVLQPEKLAGQARRDVGSLDPDILVVVAYGKIFGPKFLSLFSMGGINLHPSLLPLYRGPVPIPAAILNGDEETGITIQRIALEMDAGDILRQYKTAIGSRETAGDLTQRLAERGAEELVQALKDIESGAARGLPQDPQRVTYCKLIEKKDGIISWSSTAVEIHGQIRAYCPWPTAYTTWDGTRLVILQAHIVDGKDTGGRAGTVVRVDKSEGILVQTGGGILAIEELQLQSRKALPWQAFVNGMPDIVGSHLGGD